jgi:hypothetical protein
VTTLSDLVTELSQRAFSSMREETNQLGAALPANATNLALAPGRALGSIQPGAIVQVDWELFYVVSTNGASQVNVLPGYFGSTTAAHNAGALVTVNPRFPAVDVVRAINQDIDELTTPSNGLFNALEVTLTYNPVLVGYDLTDVNTDLPVTTGNIIGVLAVRVQEFGPQQLWPMIPLRKVKLERNADPTVFPSGMSLKMYAPGYAGQPIRVSYKAPYTTPLVNPTDDVQAVTGLHPQAHDIPVLGAACRLMEFREFKRSFSEEQPQPRTATEVPVGSSLEAMKQVYAHRQDRIDAERQRLERAWAVQHR